MKVLYKFSHIPYVEYTLVGEVSNPPSNLSFQFCQRSQETNPTWLVYLFGRFIIWQVHDCHHCHLTWINTPRNNLQLTIESSLIDHHKQSHLKDDVVLIHTMVCLNNTMHTFQQCNVSQIRKNNLLAMAYSWQTSKGGEDCRHFGLELCMAF